MPGLPVHGSQAISRPTSPLSRFTKSLQNDPSGSTTYVLLLGLPLSDQHRINTLTRQGAPYRLFEEFQRTIALPIEDMAQLVQIPLRTLTRRRQTGRLRPDDIIGGIEHGLGA